MRKIVPVALLLVGGFAPALGADLPTKAPVLLPVQAPVFSWSGFYVGAHGGYASDPASGTFNPISYAYAIAPSLVGSGTVLSGPGNLPLSVDPSGGFGGLQLGYNWNLRPWIVGWEADASVGNIRATDDKAFTVLTTAGDVLDFTGRVRLEQKVDYFGTLRARFGWANDVVMLYATGGLAWGHVRTSLDVYNVSIQANGAISAAQAAALVAGASDSESKLRVGYSVGAGLEWALTQAWSIRGEYLFIDLGSGRTLVVPGGSANSDFSMHTGRIAINYHFAP